MKQIKIKAIVLGLLTDIGGSLLASIIFGTVLVATLVMAGVPSDEIISRAQGPIVLIPGLIIGFGFTILGGFVAGRVARQAEVLHGGILGGIDIPFGLVIWSLSPLWLNILSLIATIPMGMVGGYFAKRGGRKNEMSSFSMPQPPSLPAEHPS